jgi:hypothetical protein
VALSSTWSPTTAAKVILDAQHRIARHSKGVANDGQRTVQWLEREIM